MMARSTRGSNQRPDTLMQDRTSANSMKVLLQRTAGPYIGSGADITRLLSNVRFTPQSGQSADMLVCPLSANSDITRCSKFARLFDHLVGAGERRRRHVERDS